MGYDGNILLKTNGGRRGRDRKSNLVGGERRGGGDAETESLILWLVVLELLVVLVAWWLPHYLSNVSALST